MKILKIPLQWPIKLYLFAIQASFMVNKSSYLLTGVLIWLISSCGGNKNHEDIDVTDPEKPFNVVVQWSGEIGSMHPSNDATAFSKEVFCYIHGFLIREDIENYRYSADLVEEMPDVKEDSLAFRFKLREGIRFDDGSPITTDDVLFSLQVVLTPWVKNDYSKGSFVNIDSLAIGNSRNFTLYVKKSEFSSLTALSYIPILQKSVYDPDNTFSNVSMNALNDTLLLREDQKVQLKTWAKGFNDESMGYDPMKIKGCGPYQITELSSSKITLERKENYWGQNSKVVFHQNNPTKIIFKVTLDENTKILEARKGEVDLISGISSKSMVNFKDDSLINSNYTIDAVPVFALTLAVLNVKPNAKRTPIFTDVKVRHAIGHLLQVDELIRVLSNGNAVRIASPISILKEECDRTLVPYPFDPEKAQKLLDEAGWKDSDGDGIRDKMIGNKRKPLTIEFTCSNSSPIWTDVLKILIDQMRNSGIDAKIDAVDPTVFDKKLFENKDFDVFVMSISNEFGPHYSLSLYETNEYPAGRNFSGFSNKEVDSLSQLIPGIFDIEKRKEILFRLQKIYYEQAPYLYITTGKRGVLMNKRFKPVKISGQIPMVLVNALELNQ